MQALAQLAALYPTEASMKSAASDIQINWQSELDRNIAIYPTLGKDEQAGAKEYIEYARKMVREQMGTAKEAPSAASMHELYAATPYTFPDGTPYEEGKSMPAGRGLGKWLGDRAGDVGFAVTGGLIFILGIGFVLYRESKKM